MQVAMDLATITGQREDDLLQRSPNRDPEVYSDEGLVLRPTSPSAVIRVTERS